MILYKLASRSRPNKFKATVNNIQELSSTKCFIQATADFDDQTMNNEEIINFCIERGITLNFGNNNSKVEAINYGLDLPLMRLMGVTVLVNMSDDMIFLKRGFDEVIKHHCGADTFLHASDQHTGQAICTLSILGIDYFARDGYIYHPAYKSLWCDNEATEVAKKRLCYKWINDIFYEHAHTAWLGGQSDDLLKRNESFYYEDKYTYEKRKAHFFPKESVLL